MSENIHDNPMYVDENTNNGARKKRRRRPNPNETETANTAPKPNIDNSNEIKREPRRRRRKEQGKQSEDLNNNGPIGVGAYLEDLQDDIEMKVNSDDVNNEILTISRGKPSVSQGLGDKVYIEGVRNFRVENHDKYVKTQQKLSDKQAEKLRINENDFDNDLMQCSIGVTNRFRIFATFLHGILAGMTLMHLVFCLVVGGTTQSSQQSFLGLYAQLQQPFSIFNYVAFVIILISLWDRVDVGQPSPSCSQPQIGVLVALILTFIAFIINNSLYLYNQDFLNYNMNSSTAYLSVLLTSFGTWKVLDAVKSILLVISWFIVAMVPIFDRFVEQLNENMDHDLNENY